MSSLIDKLLKRPTVPAEPAANKEEAETVAPSSPDQSAENEEVAPPSFAKPEGLSDEDYAHLQKFYTPEQIANTYKPYDPSTNESYYQRLYSASSRKPKEIDEKAFRKSKTIGSIGDSVRLLAQLYAANKGAYIQPDKEYLSDKLSKREDEIRNIYLEQLERYNRGRGDAATKDFVRGLEEYRADKKGMQAVLANKQKYDFDREKEAARQAQWQANYQRLAENDAARREQAAAALEETKRRNKVMEGLGYSRLADSKNRTTAYITRMNSAGAGKKSSYRMVIEANPGDRSAEKDQLGNGIKVYDLDKGDVDAYARAAISDPDFMRRHPELVLSRPQFEGTTIQKGSYKYKPNSDIAAAYVKELYDNSFANQAAPAIPDGGEGRSTASHLTEGEAAAAGIDNSDYEASRRTAEEEEDEYDEFIIN